MGLLDGWGFDPTSTDPSSSGVAGSLLNPKMLPLLYAAAAAGQAAAPSRLPVPLGSVMGQIAGGVGAGMQAGQQGQLSQQELYGRQIQNALNTLTLRGFQRLQSENGGNPATAGGALAASMSPNGATAPAASASGGIPVDPNAPPGADNSAFTADPNSPGAELRPALHGGLLVPHYTAPAGSYLANLANFESGGDPNATNAKSSAVGPYQFTKPTWDSVYGKYLQPRGFANDPTDPTASAVAADAYARQNAPVLAGSLNRAPVDSELGMAHFLGGHGAVKMLQGNPDRPATDFASQQAVSANPQIFYRPDGINRTAGEVRGIFDQRFGTGATAIAGGAPSVPSAPGGLLSGAQPQNDGSQATPILKGAPQALVTAAQAVQMARQYMFPGGEAMASHYLSMAEKMLPPGYFIGTDGDIHASPGYLQGEGAVAGAKKAAELPFTSSTIRPGGVQTIGGRPVYQAPVGIPGVTQSGAPTTQFVTPAMPNGNPGSTPTAAGGAPSTVSATATVGNAGLPPNSYVTGLDPLTKASMEKRGGELEDYGSKLQTSAADAVNQQFLVDQMRRESSNGAGWTPGAFANWVGDARALFNGAGISSAATDAALANYQAFQKNGMALVTQATRAVSPRAAVQEMQMIAHALPNAELSSGGLSYIFDQLSANNDFIRSRAQAAEAWRGSHNGTLAGFDSAWNQTISPFAFLSVRMSKPDYDTMAANLGQTTQGRGLLARIRSELQYGAAQGVFQTSAQ